MELEHEFTVPVPVEEAWPVLMDVERVAPCMPGASLDSVDGDAFTGRLKVKVGPITVTYKGDARFSEKDADAHAVTLEASGKEARGTGTASATVRAELYDAGDETRVTVRTSFNVTGKPAQFGRGVLSDVGGRLIDRFAKRLADQLAGGEAEAADGEEASAEPASTGGPATAQAVPAPRDAPTDTGATAASGASAPRPTPVQPVVAPDDDAIDLFDVAGMPMLKRIAPIAGGLAILFVIWRIIRGRRHR